MPKITRRRRIHQIHYLVANSTTPLPRPRLPRRLLLQQTYLTSKATITLLQHRVAACWTYRLEELEVA